MPELRVCALYPDLMNIYADRGNLLMLKRRCRWRRIGFAVTASGGTYPHGLLLPKNAWFADWLIATALAGSEPLAPLENELEAATHSDARRAAGV
ncbi:MAG: hypothetical protein WBP81_19075 [Solirubrobacteraceae bacterium]